MRGGKQPTPRGALSDFAVRVIVAGSRNYDDYEFFSKAMHDYVDRLVTSGYERDSIVFISGVARTGADAMIVEWCQEFDYPWSEFPAEWDNVEKPGAVVRFRRDGQPYNVKAGYDRNDEMADVGTNLMVFWNGVSKGTLHMQESAVKRGIVPDIILIDINKDPSHGRESQSGGSRHSDLRG